MLRYLIEFATRRWIIVLALTAAAALYGWKCFRGLPIEAFPDVTDPSVEIVGLFPGQAAEEVERRVTIELERVLAGTPRMTDLRSVSVFGLALLTLTFEEGTSDFQLRTVVAERLETADLPDGSSASMGPQSTPVGQILRYTLTGPRDLKELRAIEDFVVERRLRAVPGVADVVTFGGFERNYQVRIDPLRLAAAGVSIDDVFQALNDSNSNSGGGYVAIGSQEFVVRGLGVVRDPAQLGNVVVAETANLPLRIRDVADIAEGATPRRGSVGRGHCDEVVEGIVLLRRGANPSQVLHAVHERIDLLNSDILPKDVKLSIFYDRTTLVDATLATVGKNLLEGAALVLFVVYCFLRTWRAVLIVATVIPLALLSAFAGLSWLGLPANLISLGAIDFGILVDGAIIVVEATLHGFEHTTARDERRSLLWTIPASVARPVLFSMLIIIVALAPVFFLERVEGRIFAPMAYTYAFALAGALVAALVVVPAMQAAIFQGKFFPREPKWVQLARRGYLAILAAVDRVRGLVLVPFSVLLVALGYYATGIGTEFLPELNEGGIYITTVFPSTISLVETQHEVSRARDLILQVPEVTDVLSHIGRPEDATQAEGPNNAEFFVDLKPQKQWRRGLSRAGLERQLRQELSVIPGAQQNFSQPITDRVFETISGIIGQVVVKVRGSDLAAMTETAEAIRERLSRVDGVVDLALYQAGDVPSMQIDLNRDDLARRGLSVEEVQSTIRAALGGELATELWQDERRFPVSIRLPEALRSNVEMIGRVFVGDPDERVTLSEVADVRQARGRASIWREDLTRFVAVKFNVRGRDLGSTVEAGKAALADLELPEGQYVTWGGEFQNQQRAMRRLTFAVPIALLVIVAALYTEFGRWSPTLVILASLPLALVGAIAGLRLFQENFSVSSAVGCIALLGQVVLSGVIYCSQLSAAGRVSADRRHRLLTGSANAFRPVLLTSVLAVTGLLPAAFSHAMGSETQRPFALAIVCGLLVSIPAVLFILPIVYTIVVPAPAAHDPGSQAALHD